MEYTLNGKQFTVTRYKLREWLKLDAVREKIVDAIDTKNVDGFANSLCSFVSIASNVSTEELNMLPWYEVAEAFIAINQENQLRLEFALLRAEKKKQELVAWDYDGRSWYWWLDILSSRYGWSQEYIADMDIDDATGLLQEILVNKQLEREWQWSLTEIAYPYNDKTKTSNFKPLDRPEWMMTINARDIPKLPVMRMRRDMMPVGIVKRGKSDEPAVN